MNEGIHIWPLYDISPTDLFLIYSWAACVKVHTIPLNPINQQINNQGINTDTFPCYKHKSHLLSVSLGHYEDFWETVQICAGFYSSGFWSQPGRLVI